MNVSGNHQIISENESRPEDGREVCCRYLKFKMSLLVLLGRKVTWHSTHGLIGCVPQKQVSSVNANTCATVNEV